MYIYIYIFDRNTRGGALIFVCNAVTESYVLCSRVLACCPVLMPVKKNKVA